MTRDEIALYNEVSAAGDSNWHNRALKECIERLVDLGELLFDDEETMCYYWESSGNRLGEKKDVTATNPSMPDPA